jgi:hypothetical protein
MPKYCVDAMDDTDTMNVETVDYVDEFGGDEIHWVDAEGHPMSDDAYLELEGRGLPADRQGNRDFCQAMGDLLDLKL